MSLNNLPVSRALLISDRVHQDRDADRLRETITRAIAPEQIRAMVIAVADAQLAQYPQYAGRFNGGEWRAAFVTRVIKTKVGLAFLDDDVTIARGETEQEREQIGAPMLRGGYVLAYSVRNKVTTSIPAKSVEFLEEARS